MSTADQLVSEASVRFLQDSAYSGDEVGLKVTLPAVTPGDLDVVVTFAPGTGDNPAVPGVDYVDEPISVTIPAGTSSAIVTVQLPLNSGLNEARSLSVTVTLSDTEIRTEPVGTLSASGSSSGSVDLTAPSTPGPYYYGACVDAVTDETESTNNCSSSVEVEVTSS